MYVKLTEPLEPQSSYIDSATVINKISNDLILSFLVRDEKLRSLFEFLKTPQSSRFQEYTIETLNCKPSAETISIPFNNPKPIKVYGLRINYSSKSYAVNFQKSGYDLYEGFNSIFEHFYNNDYYISENLSSSLFFFTIVDKLHESLTKFKSQ